jgi:hypothetical protein
MVIGGGADTFVVPSIPAEIGLWMAIMVAGPEHELRADHEFEQGVLDPSMEELSRLRLTLPVAISPLKPEGWEGFRIFPTFTRIPVQATGGYTIDLAIDGRHTTVGIVIWTPDTLPGAQPEAE